MRVTHFYDEYTQNGNVFMVEELIEGGELFHRIVRLDHYSEIHAIELVINKLTAIFGSILELDDTKSLGLVTVLVPLATVLAIAANVLEVLVP